MANNEGDSIVSNEREEGSVTFDRHPSTYRHWHLEIEPPLARLTMEVDADGGLNDGYQLKLNSYDLGVDIELNDAIQRLRFEHPEVRAVIVSGGLDKMFCAGANIQMLAGASHHHKVNFCKFTNETRNSIEDAPGGSTSATSGATWPMYSPPAPRASGATRRWSGAWSTPSPPARSSRKSRRI